MLDDGGLAPARCGVAVDGRGDEVGHEDRSSVASGDEVGHEDRSSVASDEEVGHEDRSSVASGDEVGFRDEDRSSVTGVGG